LKKIDYQRIEENLKRVLKTNRVSLVLKNDAYGFKMDKIIPLAIKNNVDTFYLNTLDEAIKARVICDKRLILLGPSRDYIVSLIKYKIIPTAINIEDYQYYTYNSLRFALELDSGMNRFGIKKYNERLFDNEYLEEVYMHFYTAKDDNLVAMKEIAYLCNKYNKRFTFGGSLAYGYHNYPLRIGRLIYENSISLYGRVLEIKRVLKGETVGYEGEFKAPKDLLIAVTDIGYYNGLRTHYKGRAFIKNKYYNIVGRICMNHSFIEVDEDVSLSDVVEYLGENIEEKELLDNNNMTKYESFLWLK